MLDKLKEIAPNVAFSISREYDPDFQWDGDGPDPQDEGYEPQNVTVTANAIVNGELIEGNAYLGGSYDLPDAPCPNVHGYLPQMIEEALTDLEAALDARGNSNSVFRAFWHLDWIKAEMTRLYNEQQVGTP
jgi:hypothetical protein